MTTDDLRDELAREMGYALLPRTEEHPDYDVWADADGHEIFDVETGEYCHPIPATLDGASAAMPEGWTWTREYVAPVYDPEMGCLLTWTAFHDKHGIQYVTDTGCEIHDRLALALAARRAMKGTR